MLRPGNVRLDGSTQRIEEILDFARLFSYLVEGARVGGLIPGTAEGVLAAELVAGCTSDLSHNESNTFSNGLRTRDSGFGSSKVGSLDSCSGCGIVSLAPREACDMDRQREERNVSNAGRNLIFVNGRLEQRDLHGLRGEEKDRRQSGAICKMRKMKEWVHIKQRLYATEPGTSSSHYTQCPFYLYGRI